MRNFPNLFRRFMLRAVARHRVRTLLALAGIVLGVAVMVAVRLANRSALDSFRSAVEYVRGEASLRIRGASGRFDERLLTDRMWLRDYGVVSPVIEAYAMAEETPAAGGVGHGPTLRVLGVDVLEDLSIRKYRLLRTSRAARDPTPPELLRLLTDADAVVVTERFAQRQGKRVGDPLVLIFGSRRCAFRIRGLLLDEGPGRALDGNFALMDIAAAQVAAGRLGKLDYVDIKLDARLDPAAAEEAIRRRLPPALVVERPDSQVGRSETMVAAFQFNLTALSGVALLVGMFLIYNTVSVSVAARRSEVGILQALGAGRGTVLGLFLGEAGVLALLGTLLGLVVGTWMASSAVTATARTVQNFYIAEAARSSAASLSLNWGEITAALAITIPLALLAAAVPAWEAARISPLEVIRGSEQLARGFRLSRKHLLLAAGLGLAGLGLTRLGPVAGRPVFGFLAQLLFALAGATLVPGVLWLVCRAARRGLGRAIPPLAVECRLAAANLLGSIPRLSISVAALSVSLAMMVAVSIMVGSFRQTVIYWLGATLKADLFVQPAGLRSSVGEARIDPAAAAVLRGDPAVADSGWLQSRQVPLGNTMVRLAVCDVPTILRQQVVLFKAPADAPAAVLRGLKRDEVLVSESFSLRFGKQPGDMLEVPTPAGPRPLRVAAVYYDYASNEGTILLDGRTLARTFGEDDPRAAPSNMSLYLRPGADPDAARDRLAAAVGPRQALYISTNANIRREALRVFDSTFAITYALELIALVVAGLGVVSTLITLIYQRQREIAVMSLTGATPPQIRRMVTIEALLLGVASQAVGLAVGLVLALVLIYVINVQSFGWTIQVHLPLMFLAQSTLALLAATAAAGLYPAARAANIRAIEVVREE